MNDVFHSFDAEGIQIMVDLRVGHIRRMIISIDGRKIEPLHTAPWVEDAEVLADDAITPNARLLSGDFFCAPFGRNDLEDGPTHGAPANSPWRFLDVNRDGAAVTARYELQKTVLGARVIKELCVRDGHPFLYERHIFQGGEGAVPVANHAMTRFEAAARLSYSRKSFGFTQDEALEPDPAKGRSVFAYPSRFDDLTKVPLADGGTTDLTRHPFAQSHEDFLVLVERKENAIGWTAAARGSRKDIFISLKNPAELPFTFLWVSNGGRDYSPWNGRHVGVLGVEDARSYGGYGYKTSIAPNPLSEAGYPTALVLNPKGEAQARNVLGGLPLPEGWDMVQDVIVSPDTLTLVGGRGEKVSYPFDGNFLSA